MGKKRYSRDILKDLRNTKPINEEYVFSTDDGDGLGLPPPKRKRYVR